MFEIPIPQNEGVLPPSHILSLSMVVSKILAFNHAIPLLSFPIQTLKIVLYSPFVSFHNNTDNSVEFFSVYQFFLYEIKILHFRKCL